MDLLSIESALADLQFSATRYFPTIDSTNDEAARWAEQGAPDLALVIADEQTKGRGRAGRHWFTPPDSALAFSLVLHPHYSNTTYTQQITALGAIAVHSVLKESYGLPAQIKWPNDVLIDHSKVAGVLAEAHWIGEQPSYFILGIGINIAPASIAWFTEGNDEWEVPVTCLQDAAGRTIDRYEMLHEVLNKVLFWRSHLGTKSFKNAWNEALAYRNEWVMIYQDDHPFQGKMNNASASDVTIASNLKGQLLGLSEDGGLILRSPVGEIHTIHSGEVRMRPIKDLKPGK